MAVISNPEPIPVDVMDALPAAFEDVLAAVEAAAVAAVDPVPEIVELMVVSRVS
jgi:hypothetical protein